MLVLMSQATSNIAPEERIRDAKKTKALEAVRLKGTKSSAARAAGVGVSTIALWLENDTDFAEAFYWASEEWADKAVEELATRAIEGDEQLVYYKGPGS